MPDLDDIRVFGEVVDSGSLTRAGARLGMSKSMVSRRLARLEAELGPPLLSRTHPGAVADRGGRGLPALRRADRDGAAVGARCAEPAGRGDRAPARRRADVVRRHPSRAGDGRAGGAPSAPGDQRLLQRPPRRCGGRGLRRGGAAGRAGRFLADRAADRADARAAGREPGLPRAARRTRGRRPTSPTTRRSRTATAVWQFRPRRPKRTAHRPRGRFSRRQRRRPSSRASSRGSGSR